MIKVYCSRSDTYKGCFYCTEETVGTEVVAVLLVTVSEDGTYIRESYGYCWSEFFQTDYREISAPEFAAEFDIGRIFEDIKNYCHDKSVHHS